MTAANLADIVDRLRRFEAEARSLSISIVPPLRRGTAVIAPGYHNANDAAYPAEVLGPLHRVGVMLGDAIAIAGSAAFDLIAALAQHPELTPPEPPDVEPVADIEPIERPAAKVAKRR
jgi:hypothetical protein